MRKFIVFLVSTLWVLYSPASTPTPSGFSSEDWLAYISETIQVKTAPLVELEGRIHLSKTTIKAMHGKWAKAEDERKAIMVLLNEATDYLTTCNKLCSDLSKIPQHPNSSVVEKGRVALNNHLTNHFQSEAVTYFDQGGWLKLLGAEPAETKQEIPIPELKRLIGGLLVACYHSKQELEARLTVLFSDEWEQIA